MREGLINGVQLQSMMRVDCFNHVSARHRARYVSTATIRDRTLSVHFTCAEECHALGPAVQATLFRIVQESLTNVLKHAPAARTVTIDLDCTQERVGFAITNDGQPQLACAETASLRGNGILGMRERAALFDGHLDAGLQPDGWVVRGSLKKG